MGVEVVIGLMAASGAMQIAGAYSQGKAQKAAYEYNAAVARQEATAKRRAAEIDIERQEKYRKSYLAKQEALYAKAGVQLSGSPLEVIADTSSEFLYDQMITRYNAEIGARASISEAGYMSYMGETAYKEGLVKAGTTLLSTGTGIAYYGWKNSGGTP
jgi:uncharacterized protein YdbL (DUF1318 family)